MSVMNLQPGAMVMALKDLDTEGADVAKGDFGVVFQGQRGFGQPLLEGPLVRWMRFDGSGGVCNVYDGDVVEVKSE